MKHMGRAGSVFLRCATYRRLKLTNRKAKERYFETFIIRLILVANRSPIVVIL